MTQIPSVEEALERADQVLAKRMNYMREAVEARQAYIDTQEANERERAELEERITERTKPVRLEDRKAYRAALRAGWTEQELRDIGLAEPDSKAPAKRRTRRKPAPKQDSSQSPPAAVAAPHQEGESSHVRIRPREGSSA